MKIVTKPWGKEEWLELNDRYCYKRIYINAGYKTSYQYHNIKRETNYIISGKAEIWLENDNGVVEKKIISDGDFFNVAPTKKHRVIALTDLILQEVSTPEVDDVIRLEDDTNRSDGKIENEHKTPAVLILTAGLGNRLGNLTKYINKALLPINNRAIISYIIEKFPKNYDFIVAIGYKGDSIKEYCKLTYPNHNFIFVEIDNIDGKGSGPGYSALKCKEYLQRPFYLTTCDCIIDDNIPYLDGNWLGVYPTSYPEKYSTVKVDDKLNIVDFSNKDINGFDLSFIGLAGIMDYLVFWTQLEKNIENGEIISAFQYPLKYPIIKAKKIKWFDTGNLDDLIKVKEHFNDEPLSLQKDSNEITYKENNLFIKFTPNKDILSNRVKRAEKLKNLIPSNFTYTNNFILYNWETGNTLYNLDSIKLYNKFLSQLKHNLEKKDEPKSEYIKKFYLDKTNDRMNMFINKYGDNYLSSEYNINGKQYPSMKSLLSVINFDKLNNTNFYELFHGDLQFDNIIYNQEKNKFTYIDWRESFGGYTECGDINYDLAKMYGGCIIPYDKMKNENNIKFIEGESTIQYSYNVSNNLIEFRKIYEKWLVENGFNLETIKLITAIIYINMSPLHDEKFGKMLWFKSIEMLNNL